MFRLGPSSLQASLLGLVLCASGCGSTVPAGGVPANPTPSAEPKPEHLQGTDLLPSDLDLVVRLDLARARASLGPQATGELARRAVEEAGGEPLVAQAFDRGEVLWLGLRVSDALEGDRVLVVEAASSALKPDSALWTLAESPADGLLLYEARTTPPRSGTARIYDVASRALVFVSPVEVDAVSRLIRLGPDANRLEPESRGLLSVDWRVRKPGVTLQNRFPSLASLMAGTVRVSAVVESRGRELELEGRIQCRDDGAAARVGRFLRTIVDAGRERGLYSGLLDTLELAESANLVRIRWRLPPEALMRLAGGPSSSTPPRPAVPPPPLPVAPSEPLQLLPPPTP